MLSGDNTLQIFYRFFLANSFNNNVLSTNCGGEPISNATKVLENNEIGLKLYKNMGFIHYELDPKYGKALFLEKKINTKNLGFKD